MKLVRCAIVGGIVLFAWSSVSWMALPWHKPTLKKFKNEWVILPWITAAASGSGVYVVPMPDPSKKDESKPGEKKPSAFVVLNTDGHGNMGVKMAGALAADILAAGLAAWLLSLTAIRGLIGRAGFVLGLGVFAGLAVSLPQLIWWSFSPAFTLMAFVDLGIAWFLAGLAMAKVSGKP